MSYLKRFTALLLSALLVLSPFGDVPVFAYSSNEINIYANIDQYDTVTADMAIEVSYESANGANIDYCETRLEGKTISTETSVSFTPTEQSLSNGVYTLVMEARDSNGNTKIDTYIFYVADKINIDYSYAEDESIVPSVPNATAENYYVDPLDYSIGYGTTTDGRIRLEDANAYSEYDTFMMRYMNAAINLESVSGIPYQVFDIALEGKTAGEVAVRYTGTTLSGERIAVKVYNPTTTAWDTIGTITGSGSISEAIDIATYADNDTLHVAAMLDYEINVSDTMILSANPGNYTKSKEFYDSYYQIYEYAAKEYLEGNAGYMITIGDLTANLSDTSVTDEQWAITDKAMSYLAEAGMPYGLVTGKSDVDDSKYHEYFDALRYNTTRWYGGSLNNNASHYDLVTIGNMDFIILYLGYSEEATDETILWANTALQTYSHRTAIVVTQEYLDASEQAYDSQSSAQLIYETIVDPNPNVKMVLCGGDEESLCVERTASDGRTVYEVLSGNPYADADCEGYIRLLSVEGDTLTGVTYSPITSKFSPYATQENIRIDLECGAPNRNIAANAFSAYVVEDKCEDLFPTGDSAIIITEANGNKTYHHVSPYMWPDEMPEDVATVPNDCAALNALIEKAEQIDTSLYTDDTVSVFEYVLQDAIAADKSSDIEVMTAYTSLANAIGALEIAKEATPSAYFDAEEGMLIGLVADAEYEVVSGSISDDEAESITADENGEYPIPAEWYGNTIYLIKKAITDSYIDSEAQEITIPAINTPSPSDCPKDSTCIMYPFNDLDMNTWYHDGVHYCIENGLMVGTADNTFAPNEATSRAMIVTILWAMEDKPIVESSANFVDVADDMWYSDAIRWAATNNIACGYGNGLFGPNDLITREQFATILYSYEQYNGGDFAEMETSGMDFADIDDVSEWAYTPLCWMTTNGFIAGKGNNILDPKGNALRAEIATMLYKYNDVTSKADY